MRAIAIIPARYDSTRFKGKPLADLCGRPMLWWVYHQVKKARRLAEVWVATDHPAIQEACGAYQIPCKLTSPQCPTSTQRVWEVAQSLPADLYVCVNGDEPLIDPKAFELILPKELPDDPYYVAGVTNRMEHPADVIDFSNQKVVCNARREILLISRSPIPYPKGTADFEYEKITGIQLFSKKALDFYAATPKSALEKAEENDLMRFIENGHTVHAVLSPYKTVSVDTPKDVDIVCGILKKRTGSDQ